MEHRLKIVIKEESIKKRVKEIASQINRDYSDKNPLIICILKGGFIFCADLVRELTIPHSIDFVKLSSYGLEKISKGTVKVLSDLSFSPQNRHVLIVEDIIDTGITLSAYIEDLKKMGVESVDVCVLIDKLERREVDIPIKYRGFTVEKGFLVGYGMDCGERYRNLKGIYEFEGD